MMLCQDKLECLSLQSFYACPILLNKAKSVQFDRLLPYLKNYKSVNNCRGKHYSFLLCRVSDKEKSFITSTILWKTLFCTDAETKYASVVVPTKFLQANPLFTGEVATHRVTT
jgi:hypothetical protein